MENKQVIYLPGLNGLRALASIIVIVWHIDEMLPLFNLTPFGYGVNGMASNSVSLFFILSGFLITYLCRLPHFSNHLKLEYFN
jgi:peptidoglycan/LPS O-acetylase OafA/YrhL